MKISFLPYTLELKHQFSISHNSRRTTPIVLVKLEEDGTAGYGEASLPPYLEETQESVIAFIKKAAGKNLKGVEEFSTFNGMIEQVEKGNAAAKASLDIAFHDLIGNKLNKPVHHFYHYIKKELPLTSMTIGIDSEEILRKKIEEADEFKILKIKLGTDDDRKIVEIIRKYSDKPLFVDANQGWKKKEIALEMINWLKDKNVLLIEQPMPKICLDDMKWLKENSALPLIADESVQRLNDIGSIKDAFHGINIKLMKCSGIYEADKMILKARELNLKVMLGCMTETTIGISAAIQLASRVDYADLDGNCLVANDPFIAATHKEGRLAYPQGSGLGLKPKLELNFIQAV
jgi:L-Ala-D/L-Glu epimerase